MKPSTTHLVLLPSYNTGPRLRAVVEEALRHWQPVWVLIDGSTDGSERPLFELEKTEPHLRVLTQPRNTGKGAAVLDGAREAWGAGFTHALVMDADGQHPAASIAEFMDASQAQPAALVLGRPVFPANVPAERLHGRKLSVWLVHFELGGAAVADPLFGFRVYPLRPLLAALDPVAGGRRYDFDTAAAVRLCWAGVPTLNLAAPVRYFSLAEGGVSHFHYLRDNVTLVWLHTRLIVELLMSRWSLARRPRAVAAALVLVICLLGAGPGRAADADDLVTPAHLLPAGAPGWTDLVDTFAHQPDTTAAFAERRFFPFKQEPVELKGEVRVSSAHGLSLHYTSPEERIVILDAQGMLIRDAAGEQVADPRANAANDALRHILRFEFGALEKDFALYGQREGTEWLLTLVPRDAAPGRSLGRITVGGDGAAVRRIELRRTERQYVEILIEPAAPGAAFTAEELRRYFR